MSNIGTRTGTELSFVSLSRPEEQVVAALRKRTLIFCEIEKHCAVRS